MSSTETRSFLHLGDPRAKILALLLFPLQVLAIPTSPSLAASTIEIALGIVLSGIPASYVLRRLRSILWFGIVLTLANSLTMSGETILAYSGMIATKEGLLFGLELTFRLALLVIASTIFMHTTPARSILDAIEVFGQGSRRIAQPLVLILGLTLSFSPLMVRSAQQIKRAHLARGVDLESGWRRRIQFTISASLPLFASAFRSSQHLALAMESRGYNPDVTRSVFARLRFQKKDALLMIVALGVFLFLTMEYAFSILPSAGH